MKNVFGNAITVTLFGESHGKSIGAVVDGIAPGIKINNDYITLKMRQRTGINEISTPRREEDKILFESGVYNGYTTGTPLCVRIENGDFSREEYSEFENIARPNHADFPANCKYHGFQDKSGGGHFSGRITAPIVAVGAILEDALKQKNIFLGTHISYLGGITDDNIDKCNLEFLDKADFPVINQKKREEMFNIIRQTKENSDSIGGVLETLVTGLPAGVGEPWFDTIEGVLSHAIFSIPAIKGIEFGAGFSLKDMLGSQANDSYGIKNGKIFTTTNNMGGIGGGISNGENIVFRCVVKPTPSIGITQNTIDMKNNVNTTVKLNGKHDTTVVHRAKAVVDAVTAITLADFLTIRFGTDFLGENK